MPLSQREEDNLTRWDGHRKSFYEVYYLKWNDLSQGIAGWLRYTLLAPRDGNPEFSVWGIFFDSNNPSHNLGLKKNYTRKESVIERDIFYFAPGPSAIFDGGARGDLSDEKRSLSWELKFDGSHHETLSLRHLPWPLYHGGFPKTKIVSPYLSCPISGDFVVNGRRYQLSKVPSHQAHLWGSEQAQSWAWGNCNTFDDPDFVFEGLSARINVAGRTSPPMTLLYFYWDGQWHAFNSPRQWFLSRSEHSLTRWHFEAGTGRLRFVGDMIARPEHMVGVRYDDPTGSERYCHNTKVADLTIEILERIGKNWECVKKVSAWNSAAFEVVGPSHDRHVPLLIP